MGRAKPRDLGADEEVTQYGSADQSFRNAPRFAEGEADLSVILGRLTPEQAGDVVRYGALGGGRDRARHSLVAVLRLAGFTVTHTPSRMNACHASVTFHGDWNSQVCDDFDDCFE